MLLHTTDGKNILDEIKVESQHGFEVFNKWLLGRIRMFQDPLLVLPLLSIAIEYLIAWATVTREAFPGDKEYAGAVEKFEMTLIEAKAHVLMASRNAAKRVVDKREDKKLSN